MFQITENERKIFDSVFRGNESLKNNVVAPYDLTVEEILKKDRLSSDEVHAIYKVLPSTIEFFKFANALHLAPRPTSPRPEPSEEYKARIARLKAQQANREYLAMVKTVDTNKRFDLMSGFGQEIKAANRQMTAIFNTILTVGGAFVFGYFGIEYAAPRYKLDIAVRMLIGLVLATIVFFADLYFIIKNMDTDDEGLSKAKSTQKLIVAQKDHKKNDPILEPTPIDTTVEEEKSNLRSRKGKKK